MIVRMIMLALVICTVACTPASLNKDDLMEYLALEGNGLRKSVTVGNTQVYVQYWPTDLCVAQELQSSAEAIKHLDSLRKHYDRYYYFVLGLTSDSREALHQGDLDFKSYSELVQTLSFSMADHVMLTTSRRDTIPVGDFTLNRTYGVGSATELLFAFGREKADDSEWIQFNINEFGLTTGNQHFRFRKGDLEDIPRLDLTNPN